MEWYLSVLKNYVGFSGRARRKEYWMFMLFNILVSIVLNVVGAVIMAPVLGFIYSLAVLLPSIAVSVRRLHDTGRSGWWLLLSLIPLIGTIVLLIFLVQDSHDENEHGANPKLATEQ